jgi:hypothetical protein
VIRSALMRIRKQGSLQLIAPSNSTDGNRRNPARREVTSWRAANQVKQPLDTANCMLVRYPAGKDRESLTSGNSQS